MTQATATTVAEQWQCVCHCEDITPFSGAPVRVNGRQIALYRTDKRFFALDNNDPFSQANVMARGIVGDLGGKPVVASPMYKQHFYLESGQCVEESHIALTTWSVRIDNGEVLISTTPET